MVDGGWTGAGHLNTQTALPRLMKILSELKMRQSIIPVSFRSATTSSGLTPPLLALLLPIHGASLEAPLSNPLTLTKRKIYVVYSDMKLWGAYTSKERADARETEAYEIQNREIRDPDSRSSIFTDEIDLEDWI